MTMHTTAVARLRGMLWAAAAGLCGLAPAVQAGDTGGWLSLNQLQYAQAQPGYARSATAVSGQFEAQGPAGDKGRLELKAFVRHDLRDPQGRYVDLPVAKYSLGLGDWQYDIGFDTVFWGVAESQRLVNVVNQVDPVRSLRGDVTLGQPMLSVSRSGESFKLQAALLPWFRERPFAGTSFRPGLPLPVDDSDPLYESERGRRHVDGVVRASGRLGGVEGGLSLFDGTLRDPAFVLDAGRQVLRPLYRQGRQLGLDLQWTLGSTLLKLEAKDVAPRQGARYQAAVVGLEHAFGRVGGLPAELSVFAEHNRDSRGKSAPTWLQNDLFLGLRLDFANTRATTLSVGLFHDLDFGSHAARALFDTRLTDDLNLSIEATAFSADQPRDPLYPARSIDQLALKLVWHF
jgi:hypothetical protein